LWQDDWLEPGRRRRIIEGCPSSDQPSWREKIPDLAGWSMFFGLMARRKWSRVSPPKNRPPSGSPNIPRNGWETPNDREKTRRREPAPSPLLVRMHPGATKPFSVPDEAALKQRRPTLVVDQTTGFCCGVALCPGIAVLPNPSSCPAALGWRRCATLLCTSLTPSRHPNAARRSSSQHGADNERGRTWLPDRVRAHR